MSNYTSENLIPASGVLPGTLAWKVGADVLIGSFLAGTDMGRPIQTLTASSGTVTVPDDESKVYAYVPTSGDTIALTQPAAGNELTVELWIAMPATAVSFSFTDTIMWGDGDSFSTGEPSPDFSAANTVYNVVFRYDGTTWLGNLAYTKGL